MSKISKLINIALISNIFIFNAFAMENQQDDSHKKDLISKLPGEMIATILDYCLGAFPKYKKNLEKQYKKFSNLKLVNKKFRDSINEYFDYYKLCNKYEDEILNIIKDQHLNLKDEILLAAKYGSKKYFEQLSYEELDNITKINKNTNDNIKIVEAALDSIDKKYIKEIKLIFDKLINNSDIRNDIIQASNNLITYQNIDKLTEVINFIKNENYNNLSKTHFQTHMINHYNNRRYINLPIHNFAIRIPYPLFIGIFSSIYLFSILKLAVNSTLFNMQYKICHSEISLCKYLDHPARMLNYFSCEKFDFPLFIPVLISGVLLALIPIIKLFFTKKEQRIYFSIIGVIYITFFINLSDDFLKWKQICQN